MRSALRLAGVIVWTVSVLGTGFAPSARAATLQESVQRLARDLSSGASLQGKRLGVGQFVMLDGRQNQLGLFLADRLDVELTRLSRAAGFEVVERAQLCQVWREWRLWLDDRFAGMAKKMGQLAGAEALLLGNLGDLGGEVSVSVRLLDTVKGVRLGAASASIRKDASLSRLLEREAAPESCGEGPSVSPGTVQAGAAAAPSLKAELFPEKKIYRTGEKIRFRFRVNRDAYVTLVNLGTTGDVTIIYPNRFAPDHFVRANREVAVPDPRGGFDFVLSGPPGREIVRLIASEEKVSFLPGDFSGQRGAVRGLTRGESRSLTRDIAVKRTETPSGRWAEAVVSVEVKP